MHISPLGITIVEVEVPTIEELILRLLAKHHMAETGNRSLLVIRMQAFFPLFGGKPILWEQVSVKTMDIFLANDEAYHVIITNLHGLLHHVSRKVGVSQIFLHAPHYDTVLDKHDQEQQGDNQQHHGRQKLERPNKRYHIDEHSHKEFHAGLYYFTTFLYH